MSEYPIPDKRCPYCSRFIKIPRVIRWRAKPSSIVDVRAAGVFGGVYHPTYEIVTKGICGRCGKVPLQITDWGEEPTP